MPVKLFAHAHGTFISVLVDLQRKQEELQRLEEQHRQELQRRMEQKYAHQFINFSHSSGTKHFTVILQIIEVK